MRGLTSALNYLVYDHLGWFMTWPLLVQALLILFIFDFGQYWMHRGMHNWYPLWLPHSVHHYITQLNINKGAVGNPVELFLIGLGIGGFFDFLPRAFLLSGGIGMAISTYATYQCPLQFAEMVAVPVQHHRASQPASLARL